MTILTALGLAMICVGIALVIIATAPQPIQNDRIKRLLEADNGRSLIQHTPYTGPLYSRHGREMSA